MGTANFKISTLRVVDKNKLLDKLSTKEKEEAVTYYKDKMNQFAVKVVYDNGSYVVVENVDYYYAVQQNQSNLINISINEKDLEDVTNKLLIRAKKEILNPMLSAFIYYELKTIGGLSQEQISKQLNKTQGAISNKTRLIQLPIVVQVAIIKGQIKERHGRAILQLRNREDYNKLANDIVVKIIRDNLKVDEVDDIVAHLLGKAVGKRETLKIVALNEKNKLKRQEAKMVINEINKEFDNLQEKLSKYFPELVFEKEEGTDRDDYVFLIKMKGINK